MSEAVTMFQLRAYQIEMVERSMQGNVIVAMDTGSGKTAIAVYRIMAELDRCSNEKRVWFLAPTVALCEQQFNYIRTYIPAASTRLLLGSDNVDRWSEQHMWDAVLDGVRIVVSTHAVLADALGHGFVGISNLALLVFDEAHHCSGKHPANVIMRNFYHPAKKGHSTVPCILGLSASPILRSKLSELNTIEGNLDAISVTPRANRTEMLAQVHRPQIHRLQYTPSGDASAVSSRLLGDLERLCRQLPAIQSDPSKSFAHQAGRSSGKRVLECSWVAQINQFCRKAMHIHEELGTWAADYFITQSIRLLKESRLTDQLSFNPPHDVKLSLFRLVDEMETGNLNKDCLSPSQLSDKVQRLIDFLRSQDPTKRFGVVFVQQRAVVSVLHAILSTFPGTAEYFQLGTFVGMSTSSRRRYGLPELLDLRSQEDTMAEFRAGTKNLVIATSVLEEGIDVAACNLVVCFDPPANVKSFIQRRGRARKSQSELAVLLPSENDGSAIDSYEELEKQLIKLYQDEERTRTVACRMEENSERMTYKLQARSTGAVLTADSTIAHLYHFCDTLPRQPYTEMRPQFSFQADDSGLITSIVTLPNCVDPSVRSIQSRKNWQTERAAAKDAAFQCYTALYQAHLLNEHLLPLTHDWEESIDCEEDLPSVITVAEQTKPFIQMVGALPAAEMHQTRISIEEVGDNSKRNLSMLMMTPAELPKMVPLTLYWNAQCAFTVRFEASKPPCVQEAGRISSLQQTTRLLHDCTRSQRLRHEAMDFLYLFGPDVQDNHLAPWVQSRGGSKSAMDYFRDGQTDISSLIRSPSHPRLAFHFQEWIVDADSDLLQLRGCPLLRRRNFEAPIVSSDKTLDSTTDDPRKLQTLYAQDCAVDALEFEYARFSLFIPSIVQHVEAHILARRVQQTILPQVGFKDTRHVATAITAPSAMWTTNYQRYEFIGDSILKFVTSIQLYADHVSWPEGYLTKRRASLVSNERLTRAALDRDLAAYIITKSQKKKRWRPSYVSELYQPDGERDLSTKVLADVVEALIGAAYLDSGLSAAKSCINVFVPEIRCEELAIPSVEVQSNSPLDEVETLIGYQFQNKTLLLEALTHPSYGIDARTQSYQRLEFLGDAVLDMLIVKRLAVCSPPLSQGRMTSLKAALVNAALLGYACMNLKATRRVTRLDMKSNGTFPAYKDTMEVPLWAFMRQHSPDVVEAQETCSERYTQSQATLQHILYDGSAYPWALLAQLRPEKFYSDLIESILGAIFVDSLQSLIECERFVDRIGIGSYAARMVEQSTDTLHPRDRLQQLAGSKCLEINVERCSRNPKLFRCMVMIDGVAIAQVADCHSKDEAVAIGAEAAIREYEVME